MRRRTFLHKIRLSTDLEAPKLWMGSSRRASACFYSNQLLDGVIRWPHNKATYRTNSFPNRCFKKMKGKMKRTQRFGSVFVFLSVHFQVKNCLYSSACMQSAIKKYYFLGKQKQKKCFPFFTIARPFAYPNNISYSYRAE